MERPRIALPVPVDGARQSYANYFRAMESAGAELAAVWEDPDPAMFGGLLLPGGGDIDPVRYHQPMSGSHPPDPALDEAQFRALETFVRAGKPVLGICRGHQLINVFFGGSLIQDLPNAIDHVRRNDLDGWHIGNNAPGCFLEALYGAGMALNSSHHQAVDAPGADIEYVQRAQDGTVEALMHRSLPIYGVQWHPERMRQNGGRGDTADGRLLLAWFAGLCR